MIVVVKENANGKIEFTKDELEELLEKARQEGVKDAQKNNYITTPSNPSPLLPNTHFQSPFTCETPKAIPCDERIGISTKH